MRKRRGGRGDRRTELGELESRVTRTVRALACGQRPPAHTIIVFVSEQTWPLIHRKIHRWFEAMPSAVKDTVS